MDSRITMSQSPGASWFPKRLDTTTLALLLAAVVLTVVLVELVHQKLRESEAAQKWSGVLGAGATTICCTGLCALTSWLSGRAADAAANRRDGKAGVASLSTTTAPPDKSPATPSFKQNHNHSRKRSVEQKEKTEEDASSLEDVIQKGVIKTGDCKF
jgi:hypothetical protein